jgi:ATP-dependent Clp protease ATP-binding subunit ClpC
MALKFSLQTKTMIRQSRLIAHSLGNDVIEIEHFILAMLKEPAQNKVTQYLESILSLDKWNELLEARANLHSKSNWHITLSKQAEMVLKMSYLEGKILKDEVLENHHILLSILHITDVGTLNYTEARRFFEQTKQGTKNNI